MSPFLDPDIGGYFVASISVARRFSRPSTGFPTVTTNDPDISVLPEVFPHAGVSQRGMLGRETCCREGHPMSLHQMRTAIGRRQLL